MMRPKYFITVKVGKYKFTSEFESEPAALECFDSIALVTDGEVTENAMTQIANAQVEEVTIQRIMPVSRIGDPNRQ